MCYHANTCKQCSDVLHVGLGYVRLLCSMPLSLFLYVLNYVCDMFPGVFLFEFECDHFHALFLM